MKMNIKKEPNVYSVYSLYKSLKPFDDKDILLGYIYEQIDKYNKDNNWCLVPKDLYIESRYGEDNDLYNRKIDLCFRTCKLPKRYIQIILFNYGLCFA